MREIQLKDVKAKLSAVVDQALAGEPTIITRHGKKDAVIVSFDQYQRLAKAAPTFGELLASFPGRPEDIPERNRKPFRPTEF